MLLLRQCPEPILHILFCPVLGEAVALKPLSSRQSLHDVHYTGHLRDRRASDRAPDGKVIAPSQGPQRLCVLKTRFGNSGDEGRRERAHRAGWRDGSERLC